MLATFILALLLTVLAGLFLNFQHGFLYICVDKVYVSQVQKMGYGRYIVVHAWLRKGDRSGTLADVQVSRHNSTVHVQRFSLPKQRSRQQ